MKGIILAAGKGTRLYPITKPICKPLLPVYDKPMLYCPLSVLQQVGIREVLVIVAPNERDPFVLLLGDGRQLGMRIRYKEQLVQRGIADAFIVGEEFIGDDDVCLILGDNIFHGERLQDYLHQAMSCKSGATIFGCWVENPRAFGVVELDETGKAISIEEKLPTSSLIMPCPACIFMTILSLRLQKCAAVCLRRDRNHFGEQRVLVAGKTLGY